MDNRIKKSIDLPLRSISQANQELQQPASWHHDRTIVRKRLIKLIQLCTALLNELEQDEQQQELDEKARKERIDTTSEPPRSIEQTQPEENPLIANVIGVALLAILGLLAFIGTIFTHH